jgi:hypothetical protein
MWYLPSAHSPLIKRWENVWGEHRGDKLSCGKIQNKLVKNNKSPVPLVRLIKLRSEFWQTNLVILYTNFPVLIANYLVTQQQLSYSMETKNMIRNHLQLKDRKQSLTIKNSAFPLDTLLFPNHYSHDEILFNWLWSNNKFHSSYLCMYIDEIWVTWSQMNLYIIDYNISTSIPMTFSLSLLFHRCIMQLMMFNVI